MPCCHCKLNITILVLSSTALFIQVLLLALKDFEQSVVLQVIIAILNASLAFIQSLQIGLKKESNSTPVSDVENSEKTITFRIDSARIPNYDSQKEQSLTRQTSVSQTEAFLQPVSDSQV